MTVNEREAQRLAGAFRADHGLGLLPVHDIFELIHTTVGIDVISMDAAEAEHGLSMLDPTTTRTVIAVATTRNPMRQRSSAAHELGHVLAGDLDREQRWQPGHRSPPEIRADAFARHVLLPVEVVRARAVSAVDRIPGVDLSDLVQEFRVSPQIAAIQLRAAGLIDQATCTAWSATSTALLAARFGWLSQLHVWSAASAQARAPQSLMTRAVEGYRRGVLGIRELAHWYAEIPEELQAELDAEFGVEPSDTSESAWDVHAPLFPDDLRAPADGSPGGAS